MPFLGDVQSELDEVERRQRARETARATAARVKPESIPQIVSVAQRYPWIPAGVTFALGQAGIPEARIQQVAEKILQMRQQDPQGLYRLGEKVLAEQEKKRPKNESAISKVFGGVKTGAGWATGVTPVRKALGSEFARNNPVTDKVLEPTVRAIATGDNPVANTVKGASRAAVAFGDFPIQYTQGSYRYATDTIGREGVAGYLKGQVQTLGQGQAQGAFAQTDLGASVMQLAATGEVDQGSGFFTGDQSGVANLRRAQERTYGVIMWDSDGDGVAEPHSRSIGRDAAGLIVEPGTKPYHLLSGLTDLAVAIGASAPTMAMGKERTLAKGFKTATSSIDEDSTAVDRLRDTIGMIARPGGRATYSPRLYDYWADTSTGRKVIDHLAGADAYDIYKASKGQMDSQTLKMLAERSDPDDIRNVLRHALGHGTESIPTSKLDLYGAKLREGTRLKMARRLANRMPTTTINLDDGDEVLQQLDRQMDKMKSSPELKRSLFNRMAAIEAQSMDRVTWNERKAVYFTAVDDWYERAVELIMRNADGAELTAKQQKRIDEIRNIFRPLREGRLEDETIYDMDAVGRNRSIFDAVIDGDTVELGERPSPWLLSEFVGQHMGTPDWDEAAATVSKLAPLLRNPAVKVAKATMLSYQEKLWKPFQILRPALATRVIGEEQAAMYGAGMTSFIGHPIQAMSWVLADSKLGERLRKYGATTKFGRGEPDVYGRFLGDTDEFREIYGKSTSFRENRGRIVLDKMARYKRGEEGFHAAAADELAVIAGDPIGRMAAKAMKADLDTFAIKEAFWQMDTYRKKLANIAGPGRGEVILKRPGADAYVEGIIERIQLKTGNRNELIDAIAEPNWDPDDLVKLVTEHDDALPDVVKGQRVIEDPAGTIARGRSAATSWLFSTILLNPERSLSRSPALRQQYWRQVQAMAPHLDPKDADTLIASAKAANLGRGETRLLERSARAQAENPIGLDTLHETAVGHAVDNVQRIFEDLIERRNIIEGLRLVAPFGHVWAEAMTRWGGILKENPLIMQRLGAGLETGRDPAFGELTGAPEGRGFLYHDPATGQERFAYPLSAQMMGMATGANIPLTGSLKGMSLGFDVIPGLGPVVAGPVEAALPNGPEWDDARSILFPHGPPKDVLDPRKSLAPTWAQRVLDAAGFDGFVDQRTKANATWDAARYLSSTGDYDLHNPAIAEAEGERLLTDARSMSTKIQLMRGIAGAGLPSAPAPEWWLEDKTGRRFLSYALSQEYDDLLKTQPESATLEFLKRHGEGAMLMLQGKTISVALGGGLPPTKQADKWDRANRGLGADLPLAYGFFAPRAENDDFDFGVYTRQLEAKDRIPLTPKQMLESSNRAIATAQYYAVRNKAPKVLNPQQAAYMRKFREELAAKYPGYSATGDDIPGFPARASIPDTIAELRKAASDERLADNALTEPLTAFLRLHEKVEATSRRLFNDNKDSWQTVKKAVPIRQMYYEAGQKLAEESPEFAVVWETVFYREFETQYERDQGIIDGE